ncbi:type II secretion system F family protein [Desulfoluna sp.]|uniref:type II secretion system F family protein n=1 Tax=Desulfoluna sp. TaxID=2045199 RepID=UPI002630D71C|nr:type II secretion system F family protein [Desulfoluna sp.]
MPLFEYNALTNNGKTATGIIDCDSAQSARQKLRSKRLYPVEVHEVSDKNLSTGRFSLNRVSALFNRVRPRDLTLATRQMATLINAGFTLVASIDTLIQLVETPRLKQVFSRVKDSIEEGSSFAEALSSYPGVFSPVYINMVMAGEASGTLDIVLERLAEIGERQLSLSNRIRAALTYPFLMTGIGVLILYFLMTIIVPKMAGIFDDLGQALPLPTRILLRSGEILGTFWWVFPLLLILLITAFKRFQGTPKGALMIDKMLLRLPIIGTLIQKVAVTRFSRTLGSLLTNGVSMLTAMDVARNVAGNLVLSDAASSAASDVEKGGELGEAMSQSRVFPLLAVQMVRVGEKSGKLEEMLGRVADVYEGEVESSLESLTSIIEPVIILVMGVTVGFIVLAICLPIFTMNQFIG